MHAWQLSEELGLGSLAKASGHGVAVRAHTGQFCERIMWLIFAELLMNKAAPKSASKITLYT